MQIKDKKTGTLRNVLLALLSSFIGAFTITYILIPCGLTSGGVPGLSRILTKLIDIDYSFAYYGFTVVILVIVFAMMGIGEIRRIILMSVAYPTWIYFMERIDFALLGTEDRMLGAVLVGVGFGLATGIGYLGGYSSGGTDSLSRAIKFRLFPYWSVSRVIAILDGLIVFASIFFFDTTTALYALITMYLTSVITGKVLYGFTNRFVEMEIITAEPDKTVAFIINELHRSATSFDSLGEYSQTHRKQIDAICTPRESIRIKQFLAENDPAAFVTVHELTAVWGTGKDFSDIHEVDNN